MKANACPTAGRQAGDGAFSHPEKLQVEQHRVSQQATNVCMAPSLLRCSLHSSKNAAGCGRTGPGPRKAKQQSCVRFKTAVLPGAASPLHTCPSNDGRKDQVSQTETQQKASGAQLRRTGAAKYGYESQTRKHRDKRMLYRNSTCIITYITQAHRCTFKNMLHGCISTTL